MLDADRTTSDTLFVICHYVRQHLPRFPKEKVISRWSRVTVAAGLGALGNRDLCSPEPGSPSHFTFLLRQVAQAAAAFNLLLLAWGGHELGAFDSVDAIVCPTEVDWLGISRQEVWAVFGNTAFHIRWTNDRQSRGVGLVVRRARFVQIYYAPLDQSNVDPAEISMGSIPNSRTRRPEMSLNGKRYQRLDA